MKRTLSVLAALVLIAGISACSSSSTPAPIPAPTTAPSGSPAAVSTAGDLAALGKDVFAGKCSSCHGGSGQGAAAPKLIGSGNALGRYGNAQALLTFISKNMPKSNAGSLSATESLRVLAFLLIQNNLLPTDALLDPAKLSAVVVK